MCVHACRWGPARLARRTRLYQHLTSAESGGQSVMWHARDPTAVGVVCPPRRRGPRAVAGLGSLPCDRSRRPSAVRPPLAQAAEIGAAREVNQGLAQQRLYPIIAGSVEKMVEQVARVTGLRLAPGLLVILAEEILERLLGVPDPSGG